MKIYKTKENVLGVRVNVDGTLSVYYIAKAPKSVCSNKWIRMNETSYEDAEILIKHAGGVREFLSKCIDIDNVGDYLAYLAIVRESEVRCGRERTARIEKRRAEKQILWEETSRREYEALVAPHKVIESTPENIAIVLRYLSAFEVDNINLPMMSIPYTFFRFNVDGEKTATMTLYKPIPYEGAMVKRFRVGSPTSQKLMGFVPLPKYNNSMRKTFVRKQS